jgi:hypothetical protein
MEKRGEEALRTNSLLLMWFIEIKNI